MNQRRFPPDFLFGAATAAYQIEGAVQRDGRGPSIWDTFAHTPGKIKGGDTADVACDHYHRWPQDFDLAAELGIEAWRFSIAWPRLFPDGRGRLNNKGIAFYDRLVDGMLERGLKPCATLFHWDLPQALEDRGGWSNSDTASRFADYSERVVTALGDRLEMLTTFNAPWVSAMLGHGLGEHAPGNTSLDKALEVVFGQHRGHGLAVQAIRAVRADLPLGIVLNTLQVEGEDDAAVQRHDDFHNGMFMEPLFDGRLPDSLIKALDGRLPDHWQESVSLAHQPLDYWGLNYDYPTWVRSASGSWPATEQYTRKGVELTDMGWEVDASALARLVSRLYERYPLPPLYITGNGIACADEAIDGRVRDRRRIRYLHDHLAVVATLVADEYPIKGYFVWSFLDNFEWAEGYARRFGIVHVDYATQERTVKDSARWYGELLATHALPEIESWMQS